MTPRTYTLASMASSNSIASSGFGLGLGLGRGNGKIKPRTVLPVIAQLRDIEAMLKGTKHNGCTKPTPEAAMILCMI